MRLLVTGATGFLGSHVAAALAEEGHDIFAVVRQTSDVSRVDPRVRLLRHNGSTEQLAELVAEAKPAAAVHAASLFVAAHASADVRPLVEANLVFGAQLLDALVRADVSALVNFGTAWQHFHTRSDDPDAFRPVCLYAATKQAFEDLAAFYSDAYGLRVVTLKLSDTYGPGDQRGKLVAALVEAARTGEGHFALSPGEQSINLAHVDDVVEAVRVALARVLGAAPGAMESFAICGAETLTLRSLVEQFEQLAGKSLGIQLGAKPYRAREVMQPWFGEPLPGWSPRIALRQGLTALLASP